jgi:hypothetical protein
MGHDGGFDGQQRPVGRRGFLVGAGAAAAAAGLAGYEGRAEARSAAARQEGASPMTQRTIELFATPLQNQFADWAFEYVAEGADVGEIEAIANDMASDDDGAYYDAWYGHAKLHRAQADEAKRRGRDHTARYHHMRAVVYASVSYKLLFGTPVDPRLKAAFNTQLSSFEQALALSNPPAEPLDIKLDGHRLSAFFLRAQGTGRHRRPTIILVNGYDASISPWATRRWPAGTTWCSSTVRARGSCSSRTARRCSRPGSASSGSSSTASSSATTSTASGWSSRVGAWVATSACAVRPASRGWPPSSPTRRRSRSSGDRSRPPPPSSASRPKPRRGSPRSPTRTWPT